MVRKALYYCRVPITIHLPNGYAIYLYNPNDSYRLVISIYEMSDSRENCHLFERNQSIHSKNSFNHHLCKQLHITPSESNAIKIRNMINHFNLWPAIGDMFETNTVPSMEAITRRTVRVDRDQEEVSQTEELMKSINPFSPKRTKMLKKQILQRLKLLKQYGHTIDG